MSDVKEIKISDTVYDIVGKGVENQRDTSKAKVWIGTNTQYDDLQSIDNDTVYYRTDNGGTVQNAINASNDGSGNNIASTYITKQEAEGIRTNCITEIPQDIKLELSAGVLTLKAGSRCYVKTDTTSPTFIIEEDKTETRTTNGTYFAFYDGTNLVTYSKDYYDYSTLPNTTSLPLAIVTVSSGSISSIDQVFNGFGYIGSTIFALPGVKGLAPNGRNSDGTLKSASIETSSVITRTFSTTVGGDALLTPERVGYPISTTTPTNYDEQTNNYTTVALQGISCRIGSLCCDNTGKIVSLTIPTAFHALDWNDKGAIAGWSMPSDRYEEFTLLASEQTYTAPANGWFVATATSSSAVQHSIKLYNTTNKMGSSSFDYSGWRQYVNIEVKTGDVVVYEYQAASGTFTTNKIYFVYENEL